MTAAALHSPNIQSLFFTKDWLPKPNSSHRLVQIELHAKDLGDLSVFLERLFYFSLLRNEGGKD
jgi:hypothetical protein